MHSNSFQTAFEGNKCPDGDTLNLRYLGYPQILVRGTISRNIYRFSAVQPILSVDARDAQCMLASRVLGIAL